MNEQDTGSNANPDPSSSGVDHGHDHGHHHDHGHSHGHDHDDPLHVQPTSHLDMDELDPANRSLAEALRASFFILFLVMIALVVSFLFSGTFSVDEGEVAIRLHFGAAVGGGQVYEPGWHLAWPEPIDEIIKIPTSVQSLQLNRPFWMQERPGEELKPLSERTPKQALEPGVDGYLLTGDRGIVHTRWTINYRVLKGDEYK
ncbi:MAG: SPFH domain-containing protein, partial [Phycisphaerae bacterium]|nr:SPFH domain-containing protein [Phycisphaerae bacterium]